MALFWGVHLTGFFSFACWDAIESDLEPFDVWPYWYGVDLVFKGFTECCSNVCLYAGGSFVELQLGDIKACSQYHVSLACPAYRCESDSNRG